ncbi:post-GPI attachment to proteins factor 3-like [Littorina saxatilis]|uniref:Post-GPI attachment to proteins factor 3 n=1 Tax=Littorina saxatilis TaxID=31220 RepID=A0AAN9BSS1_9CAEN
MAWMQTFVANTFLILVSCLQSVYSSLGDRSFVFQKCLRNCSLTECNDEEAFESLQPIHLRMLGWTCYSECEQSCMWYTVDAFVKDGSPVPQFYGKWPFVRIMGMQEPASVLFSFLNAAGHLMLLRYRQKVSSSTPMYYVWHGLALVSVNAWTWSAIYHSRDTNFTEMMDYFFALSIVMYNVFAVFCRVLGTDTWWKPAVTASILTTLFMRHIHYLAFVKFDYGYNMKFNVAIGIVSGLSWLAWSIAHHRKQPYVWKSAAVILGVNLSVLLELLDFPPFCWTLDAHSLWHACTVPLNLLWWNFVIDDGLYLQQQEEDKKMV